MPSDSDRTSSKYKIRLQVYLARCGVCSRRKGEDLIQAGRVKVDGKIVNQLGFKLDPRKHKIKVDNKIITEIEKKVYYLLNKPPGYVTSVKDEFNRPTVMELMKSVQERIFPVGRLDYHSGGLVLMTNDGKFANFISHPSHKIDKVYHVKVNKPLSENQITKLQHGVILDGNRTNGWEIYPLQRTEKNYWYEVTLHEGRNRQIRRSLDSLGIKVRKLLRVRIGPYTIENMKQGAYYRLSKRELKLCGYEPRGF